MKTLILIRHAKSSWDSPSLSDFDRPLNERGKKNAPFMGKQLDKKNETPDMIFSSPAKRAKSTAKRIARELAQDENKIILVDELYHATIKTWLDFVCGLNNKLKTIMAFGHNNGITEFANYLTGGDIANIPTCGVVKINFNVNNWAEISKGNGELEYFDYPKQYNENLE